MPIESVYTPRTNASGLSGDIWKLIPASSGGSQKGSWFWRDRFLRGQGGAQENTICSAHGTAYDAVWNSGEASYGIKQVTAGLVVQQADAEGVVALTTASSTTAGQGLTMQGGATITPAAGLVYAAEARCKLSAVSTPAQFMFALLKLGTVAPLTGGATLVVNTTNVTDCIGFVNLAAGSDNPSTSLYTYNDKASQTHAQSSALSTALAADTYIKPGIVIEGLTRAKYYINGTLEYTFTAVASTLEIPTVALQPCFVNQTDGTISPILYIDDLAVGCAVI